GFHARQRSGGGGVLTVRNRLLVGGSARVFLLNSHGAFANAFAQVSELGPAHCAFAFHFNFVHARRMDWKHTFHAFAIADAADRERLIQTAAAFANHHAGENLDAFLVAFHHFGMHPHGVTHSEVHGVLAKLFRFDFVEYCLVHKFLS